MGSSLIQITLLNWQLLPLAQLCHLGASDLSELQNLSGDHSVNLGFLSHGVMRAWGCN